METEILKLIVAIALLVSCIATAKYLTKHDVLFYVLMTIVTITSILACNHHISIAKGIIWTIISALPIAILDQAVL